MKYNLSILAGSALFFLLASMLFISSPSADKQKESQPTYITTPLVCEFTVPLRSRALALQASTEISNWRNDHIGIGTYGISSSAVQDENGNDIGGTVSISIFIDASQIDKCQQLFAYAFSFKSAKRVEINYKSTAVK